MRTMSGIEDWALALTAVFAIAFVATVRQAPHAVETADAATPATAPHFAMTITAKRLPAECKGTETAANAIYCTPFLQADAVVEMHETATAYATATARSTPRSPLTDKVRD